MTEAVAERLTGAEEVLWDLSIFYSDLSDPKIDVDIQQLGHLVDDFVLRYKGRVARLTPAEFVGAYQALEAIYDLRGRLGSFASLLFATDTTNPNIGAFLQRVTEYSSKLSQKLVFFDLEWNLMDDAAAQTILDDPVLGQYRYPMEAERRFKPYQLSEIEEQLLIEKSVTGRNAWTRFFTQLQGAMRYDFDGEKLPLPALLPKLHETDRETRKKAADSLTAGLRERLMEHTYVFNTLVADKASTDEMRKYPSWISDRNLSNKAPDAVVDALVEAVTAQYELVARHYRLKRVLLGYDELTDYDRYAPLPLGDDDSFYQWDEAKEVVLNAFEAFHPRLMETARLFFDNDWIHAPVLPNKRGGAFAHPSVMSAHPFVLVNYTGRPDDVMTLAHELGHGVHMQLSHESETLFALYTPLTTAEMASVFGEMLVFQDMMARQDNKAVQLAMLFKKVEDTFATVFRQIAMNRFEDALHTSRRKEGELSSERIGKLWMDTQRAMFGDSVTLREDYGVWWSYVSHFINTPGYVYAYAFGELLVLALYQLYEEQGQDFVPKYLELLAAGDSDYPDKLLAKIGVDLNDPNFWSKGIAAIERLVEQEEQLARELYPEKF